MAENYRRMVNAFNKVIVSLQRLCIVFGPMQLLTVAGRRSGQPRTFPIAVLKLTGGRYIIQAYPKAAWVANARAADTATLTRGRRSSSVRLVEVPVEERRALLREVVETSPASVAKRYVTTGLADAPTPDAVAAAAPRIAVFRVQSVRMTAPRPACRLAGRRRGCRTQRYRYRLVVLLIHGVLVAGSLCDQVRSAAGVDED